MKEQGLKHWIKLFYHKWGWRGDVQTQQKVDSTVLISQKLLFCLSARPKWGLLMQRDPGQAGTGSRTWLWPRLVLEEKEKLKVRNDKDIEGNLSEQWSLNHKPLCYGTGHNLLASGWVKPPPWLGWPCSSLWYLVSSPWSPDFNPGFTFALAWWSENSLPQMILPDIHLVPQGAAQQGGCSSASHGEHLCLAKGRSCWACCCKTWQKCLLWVVVFMNILKPPRCHSANPPRRLSFPLAATHSSWVR